MTIEEIKKFKIDYKEKMRVLTCSCLIEGLAFIETEREEKVLSENMKSTLNEIEKDMREALNYHSITYEV